MVGSTDAHTGLAAVEEDNFFGKTTPQEPSPERADRHLRQQSEDRHEDHGLGGQLRPAMPPSGRRRTRARRIFDAMQRKETYATTGPRMMVRFFGGWDFETADAQTRSPAMVGYTKGVPMGGDLSRAPAGQGADLPRRRAEGSDRRQSRPHPDHQGLAGRQGRDCRRRSMTSSGAATASRARTASCRRSATPWTSPNATWTNTIGAPELITVWKDPDFDREPARVLLRPRARNSDAALDRLRREALTASSLCPARR